MKPLLYVKSCAGIHCPLGIQMQQDILTVQCEKASVNYENNLQEQQGSTNCLGNYEAKTEN